MCNDEYYGLGERNREKTDKAVIGQDHFFFFSASDRRCNRACIRADCSQTFFSFVEIFSDAITKTVGFFRNWVGFI